MKKIVKCLCIAAVKTIEHDGVEHSGYMSFMILLSIFPFLVFLLALTSFVGASELGENFIIIFLKNMPELATDSIKARINELSKNPPQSLMTLAIFGSIWTASSFVECLRTILNRVYEIKSPPPYIRRRLLSIVQFLAISIFISFVMLILVIVPIILTKVPIILQIMEKYKLTLTILRFGTIFSSLFIACSLLYYIVPNVKLSFFKIAPGALLTVILWMINGYLLSSYIVYYNQLNVVYGSLGSIIATLMFFYIINIIFIYGAEFNYLLQTIYTTD